MYNALTLEEVKKVEKAREMDNTNIGEFRKIMAKEKVAAICREQEVIAQEDSKVAERLPNVENIICIEKKEKSDNQNVAIYSITRRFT